MRSLVLDLSCAVRTLRRSPFFACIAIGTLALGIAFNCIVFSVVNSVLLRSLPYADADKLVMLQGQERQRHVANDLAAPTFFFVRNHASSLEDVTAIYPTDAGINLSGAGMPSYVRSLQVSRDFFHLLRTAPIMGRTFDASEDEPNGPRVAVLSYALWKRNATSAFVVGDTLRINGENYAVIGVMPQGFRSYPEADLWLPLQLSSATADPGTDYRVMARLRNGISTEQAREELQGLSESYPLAKVSAAERVALSLQRLQDFETHDIRQRLLFLLSAVFLVLLIACANIAMLLLVRASARTHEIAIRIALGSSRPRLIQVFFFESAIVALCAGLFGIILAKEMLPLVLHLIPSSFPLAADILIDWHVAAFAFAMSAFTALLFGIAPLARLSRLELNEILGRSSFRTTASGGQMRTGRLLLVTQTALTIVLLSGSILLMRHLLVVSQIAPGFDPHHAEVAQISLAAQSYQSTKSTTLVVDRIVRRLQGLPFVEGVAAINGLPLEKGLNIPVHPTDTPENIVHDAEYRLISEDYFSVMRIPVVQGRSFTGSDGAESQPVAIVNETLARSWWPKTNAPGHYVVVGKELGPEFTDRPRLVVGVVGDVHQSSLERPARPTVFVPIPQAQDKIMGYANKYFLTSIVVRMANPENISEQVRAAVVSADSDLSIASLHPLTQVVANSLTRDRFYAFLTITFGSFALLISAVGLYGLLSYQVGLRAQEIAIRMSLGAKRSQVVMLLVTQSMRLVGIGVLAGTAASIFFQHAFASMLYNLQNMAIGALLSAILLLLIVAMAAVLLASFRIASIEPKAILLNQ
jgi:putative ABC transport system permease protein